MGRSPIHPGEILADELNEIGVTPTELARQIKVPANRITQIIQGRRSITGDTALRLRVRQYPEPGERGGLFFKPSISCAA